MLSTLVESRIEMGEARCSSGATASSNDHMEQHTHSAAPPVTETITTHNVGQDGVFEATTQPSDGAQAMDQRERLGA